jgi:hypothetical protein
MPRLAGRGKPGWLGPVGTSAGVGDTAAGPAGVGAGGAADVEPDRTGLGFLEQRDLDAGLIDSDTRVAPWR